MRDDNSCIYKDGVIAVFLYSCTIVYEWKYGAKNGNAKTVDVNKYLFC